MTIIKADNTAAIQTAIADTLHRAELLQTALAQVLKEGQDYGPAFPGDTKKSLLKPGAEKLCSVFGLVPSTQCQYTELAGGHLRVVATCEVATRAGEPLAKTEAVCSTMEAKYRFRGAKGKQCPKCGAMAIHTSKAEFGGGYYCKQSEGGCKATFKAGTPEAKALDMLTAEKNENDSPADQWNTVSKMAQKRALMSAILLATGASSLFTTDEPEPDDRANTAQTPRDTAQTPRTTAQQRDERFISVAQLAEVNNLGVKKWGNDWPLERERLTLMFTGNGEKNLENCSKELYPLMMKELQK